MNKFFLIIIVLFVSLNLYSQSIYKGLEYGMTESEAKREFKSNKDTYKTVDLGNNFLYRIYKQNFVYDNDKLVGVLISPKGSALGQTYNSAESYLIHTRVFFEDLGYETFIDNEWWNAPHNYVNSNSKWGLVLNKPDNSIIVQLYPTIIGGPGSNTFLVKLMIWDYNTWVGWYNQQEAKQRENVEDSGF